MNVKEETICRLCLKVAENDFMIIDDTIRKMIEGLLLKVNLDITKDPIICKDCANITAKYFNFKSAYMDTKRLTSSFTSGENKSMVELRNTYTHEKDIDTVHNFICRLCSDNLSGSSFVLSFTLLSDVTYMKILQRLIPEMVCDTIKDKAICTSCKQNMGCYSKFIGKCLDVEEKITEYIQTEYVSSSGQVKLSEILRFSLKDRLELEHNQIAVVKHEDMNEAYPEVQYGELIKTEDMLDIKDEEINYNETACETPSDMGMRNDNLMQYKNEITKKTNQMLSTKYISEALIFNCALCTYQTKHKGALKRHMLIHKDIKELKMYKCSMCIYETKLKANLKRHMVTHKDITEVEMYKCPKCIYEAKRKHNLKMHLLIHKDITEMEMYKCSMCIHETKYKSSLKSHMLIHKDITEVEMYKCSMCVYETKCKRNLDQHLLVHKDIIDTEMYKCSMCFFETKYKCSLKCHMLIHKR